MSLPHKNTIPSNLLGSFKKSRTKKSRNYAKAALHSCAYDQFLCIKLTDDQKDSGPTPQHPFHKHSSLCAEARVSSRLQAGFSFGAPVCTFSLGLASNLGHSPFPTELRLT